MTHEPNKLRPPEADVTRTGAVPVVVDRVTFQAELDALRVREKAHTHEGDALAAARAGAYRWSSWTQLSR
jgi:hypothetical protein